MLLVLLCTSTCVKLLLRVRFSQAVFVYEFTADSVPAVSPSFAHFLHHTSHPEVTEIQGFYWHLFLINLELHYMQHLAMLILPWVNKQASSVCVYVCVNE